ncbi:MAG: hypothetical protein HYT67_00930 [Candidatus Yanofskybacteria bacterium]|nr:hypothetical protein [Candidatus Yanofskybacteria bacterium]
MDFKSKSVIFIFVVVAVTIAAAAGFWYFGGRIPLADKEEKGAAVEVKDGLGAEALNKAKNPLANELPETNPFEVNTNPFEAQTNPFNKTYQNPFK